MPRTRYWARFTPCVVCMVVITAFSTALFSAEHTGSIILPVLRWIFPATSPAGLALAHSAMRKGMHLFEFAVLAFLWCRALSWNQGRWHWRAAGLALCIAVAFASLDEFHQIFVPGRTASVLDVGWDSTGAIVALAVGLALLG